MFPVFDFTCAGKDPAIADALSRAPATDPTATDKLLQNAFVNVILQHLPATEQHLEQIKQHQNKDEVCQQLVEFWPEKHSVPVACKLYFPLASQFSVENGLLMRGSRIIIPAERARVSIWWPGISRDLERMVQDCTECCKAQKQRAQP